MQTPGNVEQPLVLSYIIPGMLCYADVIIYYLFFIMNRYTDGTSRPVFLSSFSLITTHEFVRIHRSKNVRVSSTTNKLCFILEGLACVARAVSLRTYPVPGILVLRSVRVFAYLRNFCRNRRSLHRLYVCVETDGKAGRCYSAASSCWQPRGKQLPLDREATARCTKYRWTTSMPLTMKR